MKTTLNKIRKHSPCTSGWAELLKHLGKTTSDDMEISVLTIIESNGLGDALWCLRAVEGKDTEIRLFAVWCARQVQHMARDSAAIKLKLDSVEIKLTGKILTVNSCLSASSGTYAADIAYAAAAAAAAAYAYAAAAYAADAYAAAAYAADAAYATASYAADAAAAMRELQQAELIRICS